MSSMTLRSRTKQNTSKGEVEAAKNVNDNLNLTKPIYGVADYIKKHAKPIPSSKPLRTQNDGILSKNEKRRDRDLLHSKHKRSKTETMISLTNFGSKFSKSKESKQNTKNSSTLSLHIAAYENGIENQSENKQPQTAPTAQTASKPLPEKLPRSYKIGEDQEPAVMQFKQSTKLLNPSETVVQPQRQLYLENNLVVQKSKVHGFGLFTSIPININKRICAYFGKIIREDYANLIQATHPYSGIYMFRLKSGLIVDAAKSSCKAKYINHSCGNANCKVDELDDGTLVVIAKKKMPAGTELLFDYRINREDDDSLPRLVCRCGSDNCRGFLDYEERNP